MRTIRSVLRGSGPNALHREIDDENQDEIGLVPTDGTRFRILFLPVAEEKARTNRLHLDLTTTSIDTRTRRSRGWSRSVPAISTSVRAQTKVMSCSPTPKATNSASSSRTTSLGWPLVWDQDQETAIRAPDGTGPLITWGGPPAAPKIAKNQLHLDIAPPTTAISEPKSTALSPSGHSSRHWPRRRRLAGHGRSRRQ
jgi:hypothetical protein